MAGRARVLLAEHQPVVAVVIEETVRMTERLKASQSDIPGLCKKSSAASGAVLVQGTCTLLQSPGNVHHEREA